MNKTKILLLAFLLFYPIFYFFSQEENAVPFVSQITVVKSFNKVLISWKNPSHFSQNISIYRSHEVIKNSSALNRATHIVTLKKGEEQYVDTPPYGNYFYAVLISDRITHQDYHIFIAFRNINLKPISVIKEEIYEITSIEAESDVDTIHLKWDYKSESKKERNIIIYRNTTPITGPPVLGSSLKVAKTSIHKKVYHDNPAPNIRYYYAIFAEYEQDKKYIANVNVTVKPVFITKNFESFKRFDIDSFIPLPLLTFKNDPKSGKNFLDPMILKSPFKTEFKPEVKAIINQNKKLYQEILEQYNQNIIDQTKHLYFQFLINEDLFEPKEHKDDYQQALAHLKKEEYDQALLILEELVLDSLDEELFHRVCYYIGMIYYVKGNFYKSFVYLNIPYTSYRKNIIPYLKSIYFNIYYSLER